MLAPTATPAELRTMQQLSIADKNCHLTNFSDGYRQWHKSIHRSYGIESAGVHRSEGCLSLRSDGRLSRGGEQRWVEDLSPPGEGLQLIHARKDTAFIDVWQDCQIDESLVDWWLELSRKILALQRQLGDAHVYNGVRTT